MHELNENMCQEFLTKFYTKIKNIGNSPHEKMAEQFKEMGLFGNLLLNCAASPFKIKREYELTNCEFVKIVKNELEKSLYIWNDTHLMNLSLNEKRNEN